MPQKKTKSQFFNLKTHNNDSKQKNNHQCFWVLQKQTK